MSPSTESLNPDVVSILMTDVGKKVFSEIEFTKYPEFKVEQIIEYNSRMRISPLAKFNGPCFISVINVYASQDEMDKGNALGALVLYLNEENCGKLLRKLNYSHFDEDEDEEVMELTGKLLQKYMDSMLISLRTLGYAGLTVSEPKSFKNSVPDGVAFHYNERDLFSASFFAWKNKCIVADFTLAALNNT